MIRSVPTEEKKEKGEEGEEEKEEKEEKDTRHFLVVFERPGRSPILRDHDPAKGMLTKLLASHIHQPPLPVPTSRSVPSWLRRRAVTLRTRGRSVALRTPGQSNV
ncbi:hypothetical protein [Streptomyces sp. MST-110588]|uniref:hypothetical protein n=1 Tax=Streptomyces sp. MST-110588 TaxID=2833628 RepID=UPI001F5C5B9F|nr:hypothetical protein [Streptomyces sp. MST-110588]